MLRVGVVRGGPSNEYEVSLASGASVISAIQEKFQDKYKPIDILITRDGKWHIGGIEVEPQNIRDKVDVVWNALHGAYGEDGTLPNMLESIGIPYTGSGQFGSNIGMNKILSKDFARKSEIKTPREYIVEDIRKGNSDLARDVYLKEQVQNIFLKLSPPWVVKPLSGGSSIGVSILKTQSELLDALTKLSEYEGDIIVEEYLFGKEATVSVLENYRDQEHYAFLPIEIRVPQNRFFDYEMKYSGQAEEVSPGNFSQIEKALLMEYARKIHKAIGLRHYSRSDFIVTPRGVYFLEVNTHPGLTNQSLFPKALPPIGMEFHDFVDHVLTLAI